MQNDAGHQTAFSLSLKGTLLKGESQFGDEKSKVSLSKSVYKVGSGVSAPVLIQRANPEYSGQARTARVQGAVQLAVEIDPNGAATNIRVAHSLGFGLDEKAIEWVKKWKFRPAHKEGVPVNVVATIDVEFRL